MSDSDQTLKRELGTGGAIFLGLGSMLGTGVFVSLGLAAGIAGPALLLAIILAAVLALCNGISSAQLAASHPVSGGTYEYGYRYLHPLMGFSAGWLFMIAKSLSAATAALGVSIYLNHLTGQQWDHRIVGISVVIIFTLLTLTGLRRSNQVNTVIVTITIGTLLFFIVMGSSAIRGEAFQPFFDSGDKHPLLALLHASALVFVAYTGYGRIATLGEEVHEPRKTIPRAILLTMLVTMILYLLVAAVAIAISGAAGFAADTRNAVAVLAKAAAVFKLVGSSEIMVVGALTAMLGVLLNLILGLSRVLLAMGRRKDMPTCFGRLSRGKQSPDAAIIAVGLFVAALVCVGDIQTTWTFSAFTVLGYYAITNLAALKLAEADRLFPKWISLTGFLSCLVLALVLAIYTSLPGVGLIVAGLIWFAVAAKLKKA